VEFSTVNTSGDLRVARGLNNCRAMKRVACLLLLAASTAHADGDRGYGAMGISLLFSAPDASIATYSAEGAIRIPKTPLLVRGFAGIGGGNNGGENTGTRIRDLRVGIEADTCTSERGACAFIGTDLGWRFANTTFHDEEMTRDTSGSLHVYRLGGDAGGDFIRMRLEIDVTSEAAGLQLALMHRFY
jgi:hypothetical protein